MIEKEAVKEVEEKEAPIMPLAELMPEEEMDNLLEDLDPGDPDVDGEEEVESGIDIEEHSEEADQATEEEPESEEQATEEEQPVEEREEGDDLSKAITALKRDGLSSSVIEKMTEAEIIELGEKRAKVQGDADNAYRELSELRKQQETAPESETESKANAEPTDQPVVADLDQAVKPFADIFGEDAAEALTGYSKAAVKPLVDALAAQSQMVEDMMLKSTKSDLLDRFPQLADQESYARVSTRMQTLAKSGEYSDFRSLMSDAARIEFSDDSHQASTEISSKRAKDKAAGQMSPATGSEPPSHSLSSDEREEALLDALESGMPINEAKRLYGQTD